MKKLAFKPRGVCSRLITLELDDDDRITRVEFTGGCNGNAQGIAKLAAGRAAREVEQALRGIRCGMKGTSCPDQLSAALREALGEK